MNNRYDSSLDQSSQEPQSWDEIFVPTGFPHHSFIDRPTYSREVRNFLNNPGYRILALSGLSRTGKTNLLIDIFDSENLTPIWLNGASIKSFQNFSDRLLEQLDLITRTVKSGDHGEIELLPPILKWIVGKLSFGKSRETTWEDRIDEEDIVKAMNGKVIVIDDFHRIPGSVQSEVLAYLKELSELPDRMPRKAKIDFRLIIVFIPTLNTMGHRFATDLRGRAKWLEIPWWQGDELIKITERYLLDSERVVLGLRKFGFESYGLPSVMQLYCREYCRQHMAYAKPNTIGMIRDEQLQSVFAAAGDEIWGPSGDSVYRELIALNGRSHPETDIVLTSNLDGRCGDIYRMIWYCLSVPTIPDDLRDKIPEFKVGKRLEMSIDNIARRLNVLTDFEGDLDYIRRCIRLMSDEARLSYVTKIEEIDREIDPLFEYRDNIDSLVIYDPQIIVSLAHSKYHKEKFDNIN